MSVVRVQGKHLGVGWGGGEQGEDNRVEPGGVEVRGGKQFVRTSRRG